MSNLRENHLQFYLACPSVWPMEIPRTHLIVFSCVFSLIAVTAIFTNSMLLYAYYKTDQLQTISNKFMFTLSASDLCSALFYLPFMAVVTATTRNERNCTLELITLYNAALFGYFSFYILMVIGCDRYLRMTKLIRYGQFMNNFRMKIIVLMVPVASNSIGLIAVLYPSYIPKGYVYMDITIKVLDVSGLTMMCVLYGKLLRKIRNHKNTNSLSMRNKNNLRNERIDKNRRNGHDISLARTIRLLLITMLACHGPYKIITSIWMDYKFEYKELPPLLVSTASFWTFPILFSYATVHGLTLISSNRQIRKFVLKLMRRNRQITSENFSGVDGISIVVSQYFSKGNQNISQPTTRTVKIRFEAQLFL